MLMPKEVVKYLWYLLLRSSNVRTARKTNTTQTPVSGTMKEHSEVPTSELIGLFGRILWSLRPTDPSVESCEVLRVALPTCYDIHHSPSFLQ